jgi:hypothetical protein
MLKKTLKHKLRSSRPAGHQLTLSHLGPRRRRGTHCRNRILCQVSWTCNGEEGKSACVQKKVDSHPLSRSGDLAFQGEAPSTPGHNVTQTPRRPAKPPTSQIRRSNRGSLKLRTPRKSKNTKTIGVLLVSCQVLVFIERRSGRSKTVAGRDGAVLGSDKEVSSQPR